ncbi:hypothetical protein ACSBPQ_12630 [Stenotrophomonas sp. JC08]|uniref:hypothetical protein n=1 Tax=Stenotrophomonas sp. JC08 TaxID=3445779 RepID=UPI003FA1BD60
MQIRFIPYTSAAWPGPAAMKTLLKRLSQAAGVIATTTLIAVLLGACTPGGDTSAGGAAPVELGNYENAIKVSPTLDEGRAATQVIGFDGGTISATAADGTVFTLTVPPDSVRQRTSITLTPVSKLEGLPFGNGTDVTVDLQPSGLVFDVPATLRIEPATPIPAGEQILYGYSDNRLLLAEPVLKAQGIAIVVPHFSGYGVAKGLMGDVEEARKRIGGSAEERIASQMRAVMQEWSQQVGPNELGQDITQRLEPYFEQLDREVIQPRLAAAGQSCAAGRSAILTVLGYARQRELLGYEDPPGTLDEVADLMENTVGPRCMDEEYQMCVNEHIVHRIAVAYLGFKRQLALLGIENSPVFEKMKSQVEGCLHFDLDFKVDTRFELDTRSLNGSYLSFAESSELSTEVAFSLDGTLSSNTSYFEPSSGPMESLKQVYTQKAPGCIPGTVSSWSDTGHFLAMDLDFDPVDLYNGGGGVKSIEVELGLPSPQVLISGMTCGGVTSPPMADLAGAPALYLVNHGDGFIRDWKIQGKQTPAGQSFVTATSEWSVMNGISAMASMEDRGIATLRHTPR